MAAIDVQNISLTFPLYVNAESKDRSVVGTEDPRLIIGPRGQPLGVKALTEISFSLSSGDRLAIVGRNGSGKTTLLHVLAGVLTPDIGQVVVEGRSTSLININLGMQAEATGHRNITLRGLAAGHSRETIEQKREEIAEFSELQSFLHMPLLTYSAGMRMRLNFAIATAFDPDVLILDEWLSAGDVNFKRKATERMEQFVEKAGILVLASHSARLLSRNCNKCLWLEHGRIQMYGDLKPVLAAYLDEIGK